MGRRDEDEGFSVGQAECIHATDNAIKCRLLEKTNFIKMGKDFWVPQGQVHENSEVYSKGHKGELIVTTWFAEKEGWADS